MKNKGIFTICFVMVLLVPTFVWATAIPDTAGGGDTSNPPRDISVDCYGNEGELGSCPEVCEDVAGCLRTFEESSKFYYKEAVDTCTEIVYYGLKRGFNSDGTEDTSSYPTLECRKKTGGDVLLSPPSACFTDRNCSDGNEIACPNTSSPTADSMGTGPDDFYGQDNNYKINAPSYIKLDSQGKEVASTSASWAMAKDNITGLFWAVKEPGNGSSNYTNPHDADNTYAWDNVSATFLAKLNDETYPFGGFKDWRLPTIQELHLIVNYAGTSPFIRDDYFPGMLSKYWTSTLYKGDETKVWYVDFDEGGKIDYESKTEEYYVIAVRGGSSPAADRLIDNEDGTVTDTDTGLMWLKGDIPVPSDPTSWGTADMLNWEGALLACEAIVFAGYDDWRLPNKKELFSIIDASKNAPAMDEKFLAPATEYWSSTSYYTDDDDDANDSNAWYVETADGKVAYKDKKTGECFVRAVRGGTNELDGGIITVSPTLASNWSGGSTMPILWSGGDDGKTNVKITLIQGDQENVIAEGTPNDGTFIWTVAGDESKQSSIKIESTGGDIAIQGPFSIGPGTGGTSVPTNLADIIKGLQILAGGK
ncbi:DUF1566 domain-containing protein [Desulfobacterales bacterium HSG2]|nr:DUF1566 domain-containing protein [Desulfobacterales bacterium HSG2]